MPRTTVCKAGAGLHGFLVPFSLAVWVLLLLLVLLARLQCSLLVRPLSFLLSLLLCLLLLLRFGWRAVSPTLFAARFGPRQLGLQALLAVVAMPLKNGLLVRLRPQRREVHAVFLFQIDAFLCGHVLNVAVALFEHYSVSRRRDFADAH